MVISAQLGMYCNPEVFLLIYFFEIMLLHYVNKINVLLKEDSICAVLYHSIDHTVISKKVNLTFTLVGRSFMSKLNNVEPNTEPCGTPDVMLTSSDLYPFSTTDSVLSFKKLPIQS